jgi:hypothetical protein
MFFTASLAPWGTKRGSAVLSSRNRASSRLNPFFLVHAVCRCVGVSVCRCVGVSVSPSVTIIVHCSCFSHGWSQREACLSLERSFKVFVIFEHAPQLFNADWPARLRFLLAQTLPPRFSTFFPLSSHSSFPLFSHSPARQSYASFDSSPEDALAPSCTSATMKCIVKTDSSGRQRRRWTAQIDVTDRRRRDPEDDARD